MPFIHYASTASLLSGLDAAKLVGLIAAMRREPKAYSLSYRRAAVAEATRRNLVF